MQKKFKGRSRISMVWVPPLGFDPYCKGKWLPLQDKFTLSINSKKLFLQKLWTNFEKSKDLIFSKTTQPILMTTIYAIEGSKEVLKKIQEPIPFIKRGSTFFLNFWIIFLMWITSWTPTIFFVYHAQFQSDNVYFFEHFRRGNS